MEVPPAAAIRPPGAVIPDLHRLGTRDAAGPGPIGAYVHFPFCYRHCWYCDFNVHTGDSAAIATYLEALEIEIATLAAFLEPSPAVETVYVGGGTPSYAGPVRLEELLTGLRQRLQLPDDGEFSVEANPVDVNPELLEAMAAGGATRISLGVQSFADRRLGMLDRDHGGVGARAAAELALAVGFKSVSIDLIYGTPGQSLAQWRHDLERAADLGTGHISCYALTLDSRRAQSRASDLGPVPDGDGMFPFYAAALAILESAGFEHYETSNWARPGHRCRHNAAVWAGGRYLPLGCGAHGFVGNRRYHLVLRPDRYGERVRSHLPIVAGAEDLDRRDLLVEAVTLPLRTADGVDIADLIARFDYDLLAEHGAVIDRLSAECLLELNGGRLQPSDRGMFVADALGAALLPNGVVDR